MNTAKRGILAAAMTLGVGLTPAAVRSAPQEQAPRGIDPQADKMLRQMTDYLASLKRFKVRSAAVDEVVTTAGQKIQVASESNVYVERPNHLRSEQLGAANGLAFWYDGKNMTLSCRNNNTYATAPAPANIDDTIDNARKKFQIEAPGADLLYSRPYEILTEQVTGGRFVGRETINGVATNHLAFTGDEVDWQVWIQEGPQPLPLRFVITTKTMKEQPQFVVELSNWEPKANIDDKTFAFAAPGGAKRVPAFSSACDKPQ